MSASACRIAALVLSLVCLPLQPAAGQTAPGSVPVPRSEPYRYASLRELSNEQIVRYMGQGRMMWELEQQAIPKTTTPTGFWSDPAKAAALSLADANRTDRHRQRYRLGIDDRDGAAPPKACTIAYSSLPRHGWAGDDLYVLFASPEGSWLAYAADQDRGWFEPVLAQTRCDVGFCEMEYETARHVADVIWWLSRLRTYGDLRTMSGSPRYFCVGSSADARGALVVTAGEETVVEVLDNVWYDGVPCTWSGEYRPSVLLNLTGHLMTSALPEHLGGKGLGEEMEHPSDRLPPEPGARVKLDYTKPETDRIHHAVGRILEQVARDPGRVPWPIAREAARAAGDFAFADHAPLLRRIL
ncbi:MAG TPA: hypothetical protein VFJ30_10855, partial [Phycisphaerae bacterium]|nr:hypothetical protein [Phycisphaerae bacterium]